jgi:hypothetical protein
VRKVLKLTSMMFSKKSELNLHQKRPKLKNKNKKRERTPRLVEDKKAEKNQRFLKVLNQRRRIRRVERTITSRLVISLKKMHLVNTCI